MAINPVSGRQYPLVAVIDLDYSEVTSTSQVAVRLPAGATVIGGELVVDTPWDDTGAAATIDIGDSDSASRYVAGADLKTAGRTALTLDGSKYSTTGDISVVLASGNGDATAGAARLHIMYVVAGRANEVGEPGA